MSRSYKHYPHYGFSSSEKFEKKFVNKGFRRRAKIILATSSEPWMLSGYDFPLREDIKDTYYFSKDGGVDIDPNDSDWTYRYFINGKLSK